ncbi:MULTISPECIES: hypothetical protein [Streptomyces]|uniref:Uncharacterized protein n=1 Tax=Streptomyces viridochromogenes TaxID=1938 RepID=A0A0L8KM32_STRVR|nr:MULTISPECIES: hypothetical protein [Streptomyces]KOG26925.1 hypothetical protein ADK34_16055 [Streptomyces viridochromogenes]
MGSAAVGVVGALLGTLFGAALQQMQAARSRRWQRGDSLSDAKRRVYTEYLRAISASYAQAMAGQRDRSEDGHLRAATAEITILSGRGVYKPACVLAEVVLDVHTRIAAGAEWTKAEVDEVDGQRHKLIELFKSDLGIDPRA